MVETPFPKLKLTVNKVGGHCYHNYKLGDVLILEDFTHPPEHFLFRVSPGAFSGNLRLEFWGAVSFYGKPAFVAHHLP